MFATFEGSKEDLSARQFFGSDCFLWGSDYPHTEGTFPRSKQDVEEDFSDLPAGDVRKITEANAAQLYGV
jgi:predicted TIM-barrel fold metal-dependent hydrolase